jgi:hypothetical protein
LYFWSLVKVKFQNYLGIYISKNKATIVCLHSGGKDGNILGCFSVSVEGQEDQSQQALAKLIAQGCAERELEFSEVAVALDCAMFMQHQVRSEFSNPKQVASTVRFDTEEALATDISDMAVAFQITSNSETGSELTVFTAQRKILSDILISLQGSNIDPVNMEPDVSCLLRYIRQNVSLPETQQGRTLFGLLSDSRCYFLICSKSWDISTMRTFLVGPKQDRNELLARQGLITTNVAKTGGPICRVEIFDSTNSVSPQQIGEKLGIEAAAFDLVGSAAIQRQNLTDCADVVGVAIAYGAALSHLEKSQNLNFRADYMPYQGKKLRLQKALKFLSVSLTVLLLAVGLYFQSQLLKVNRYRTALRDRFTPQYFAVMLGSKQLPAKFSEAVNRLGTELRRMTAVKSGLYSIQGEESVSSKLTVLLEALNKSAAQADINIDSILITTKSISITGDTPNPNGTQKLREALMGAKMGNLQDRLASTQSGRHSFSITIVPEEGNKGSH